MTKEEARDLLKYHSMSHEDTDNLKLEKGFLGMLRPFRGELIENNFHEVMLAIRTLSDDLMQEKIDRQLISNLWAICLLGRAWAVDGKGMLRRNKLINLEQVEQISYWISAIEMTTSFLLDNVPVEIAFQDYDNRSK